MTEHNAADKPTASALIDDTIVEVLQAPSDDVGAVLLAGWNGFTMLATVVVQLVSAGPGCQHSRHLPRAGAGSRHHTSLRSRRIGRRTTGQQPHGIPRQRARGIQIRAASTVE
ncbi:hypothetical protein [Nocardia wallacei]|uniref:hypothetical protein n=1 Tax=Nocardia wallacei TaxID=480035 RepID=UPI002458D81C|nr:hypothetical protein [Nocardia wallacei]